MQTSYSAATDLTITITGQLCSSCATTTYVGTVPGYTPGGPCHECSPYSTSSSEAPCTESDLDSTLSALPVTTSSTSVADCTETVSTTVTGRLSSTTSLPGNPGLPSSTLATRTPYKPTTTSSSLPPGVTAAAAPGVMAGGGIRAVGVVLVCVLLLGV